MMLNNQMQKVHFWTAKFGRNFFQTLFWWIIIAFLAALLLQPFTANLIIDGVRNLCLCALPVHIGRLRQRYEFILPPQSLWNLILHFLIDFLIIELAVILIFEFFSRVNNSKLLTLLLLAVGTYVYGRYLQKTWQKRQTE